MSLSDEQEYVRALQDDAYHQIVNMESRDRVYDPQGRILVEVTLPEAVHQYFETQLAQKLTPTTVVSFDVFSEPGLKQEFLERFKLHEDSFAVHRGSIIALQHEFYFHMKLVSRTYNKLADLKFPQEKMEQIHQQVMRNLGKRIETFYQQAISESTNSEKIIDEVVLIKKLNKGRKILLSQAHILFAEEVLTQTGQVLSSRDAKHLKHLAETTTATDNDVLYIDESMSMANWIGGNKVTAHDRGIGTEHLADRRILNIPFDATRIWSDRLQIRVPSLDVKKGVKSEAAIMDIVDKLEHLSRKYQMYEHTSFGLADGLRAFTYNLHTAINDTLEGGGNKQSQGARYILAAAHQYNAQQIQTNKEGRLLCLVQNISVNGYGDDLGYGADPLQREATLMTELALAYNNAPADPHLHSALQHYYNFLMDKARPSYFSQSDEGKQAIKNLRQMKMQLRSEKNLGEKELRGGVQDALRKVFAFDLHIHHDYTKLIQALSIFSEEVSISGCKSGNERAQAVNGRVAILDKAAQNENNSITKLVKELGQAQTPVAATRAMRALKLEVDKQYDHHLQGGMALVSMVDQGAAAKVKAKKGFMGMVDRNSAEEKELKHLHQSSAGSMQAHKGMTREMTAAAKKVTPSSSQRAGQIIGSVVATLFAPFILVGLAIERIYKAITRTGVKEQVDHQFVAAAPPPKDDSYNVMHTHIPAVRRAQPPAQDVSSLTKEYHKIGEHLAHDKHDITPSGVKKIVKEEKERAADSNPTQNLKSVQFKEALRQESPKSEDTSNTVSAKGSA